MFDASLNQLFRKSMDRARAKAQVCEARFERRMARHLETLEFRLERRGQTFGGLPATVRTEPSVIVASDE